MRLVRRDRAGARDQGVAVSDHPVAARRSLRLRRYPALSFLVVTSMLALLLPSGLTLPQSGPATLAEYAPVPGESAAGVSPLGDLSQSSSSGVGAGGSGRGGGSGGDLTAETTPSARGRLIRRPGTKRCVGSPPRQTEDPMSPPCIAFFEGDNFGATAKGVTGDEIRIVMSRSGCSADGDQLLDLDDPDHQHNVWSVYIRYFNDRYQTYGRRVHGWEFTPGCGRESADVTTIVERVAPFALVAGHRDEGRAARAAEQGMVTLFDGAHRGFYRRHAPFVISYGHDTEARIGHVVQALCSILAGRPARFGGPEVSARTRKFALVYRSRQDADGVGVRLLTEGVESSCGEKAGGIAIAGSGDPTVDFTRWRNDGVTTVILMTDPRDSDILAKANTVGWQPEWFEAQLSGSHADFAPPDQAAHLYGVMFKRREPREVESYSWMALKEACPECPHESAETPYHWLGLLFRAIQAAGPRLTVENVDRGLRAIPNERSPDPFNPAAYLAPGDHYFIKDAMLGRWDVTGARRPNNPGCLRLIEDGLRYRIQDWAHHPGEETLAQLERWPCDRPADPFGPRADQ